MTTNGRTLEFTANKSKRTFTIREYINGKLSAKFRSYPQSREDFEYYDGYATDNDKEHFMHSGDYYLVRNY